MKIWKQLIGVLSIGVAMLLIGFVHKGSERTVCNNVVISIDNQLNNHFVDENDVREIITSGFTEPLEGASFNDLEVRALEKRLLDNSYIETAEIFRDLKGNLLVNIDLRRPEARIVSYDGPDAYIAEDGLLLPTSHKFSSRVLLITGAATKEMIQSGNMNNGENAELLELIKYINGNKFWKAQIAQILVDNKHDIKLLPQVTKQTIEFGDLNNIDDKFKRLKVFYTQILPRRGWNSYKRVNVKYKNQIICE